VLGDHWWGRLFKSCVVERVAPRKEGEQANALKALDDRGPFSKKGSSIRKEETLGRMNYRLAVFSRLGKKGIRQ